MADEDVPVPTEPTPEDEAAQSPDADEQPKIRHYPVWVYFLGYRVETGKGRQDGNQMLKLPGPIDSTAKIRQIEDMIASHAKYQVHGIVGNRPRVTILSICVLGQMLVQETITAEGEKAEIEGKPVGEDHADQPS
jgi:hypothetical protein